MKKILWNVLTLLLFAFVIKSQQPSSPPLLRLETGMHTEKIGRISVDAAGRFLVTASNDKTARVWDIATGELVRTLRPPIGAGNEGKLFAVSVSPDGGTVAVSGWTSPSGLDESIYLFDRSSGRLLRRLSGLPNVVLHLVFAPDGRHLAATLGGTNGVRVYETAGWRQIGTDTDYDNRSNGADFDRSGRLVTGCYDGFIRLYAVGANGLRLLAKQTASGGKQPFAVRFSPDGGKIAVGFNDSTMVNVLSSADLSLQFAPDTSGVNNGDLSKVTWSATGDTLYAGGRYQTSGNFPIRIWRDGGRGKFAETNAALQTILDIQPLPNGSLMYGAGDPAWGVIDRNGSRARFVTSGTADYRGLLENFRISNDGAEIGFGYELFGKSAARFSLVERRLELKTNQNLNPPRTAVAGNLNITDWKDTYEPKLNGGNLSLQQYEMSRSLAVAPDNKQFLLGTEWSIRLYDRTSKELWNVDAPGVAWSVNISNDGRLALAAYGDGTIRWYRVSDGQELLAFFPHNDKKRWVLWTPTGYYDASPDAEDLIGWHVNNGKDAAADFFPVGLFRNQFYRPDVISKILYTLDEAKALQFANEAANRRAQPAVTVAQQLPPIVNIVSPADNAEVSNDTVTVRYNVRAPSGEAVTKIRFMIDGRPIEARGVVNKPVGEQTATISVPQKDFVLSVVAENQYTTSEASAVRLKWKGQTVSDVNKPKLYILAIGVSKYKDASLSLKFAAKDAGDFVNVMLRQKGFLYSDVVVKTLTDEQASRAEIVDGLDWISRETTGRDVAMVFMAGHGENDQFGQYYFLPHDTNPEKLKSTGVVFSEIENTIKNLAGKTLFFVDTCKAANVLGGRRRELPDVARVVNELSSAENGAVVFTAATKNQASLEDGAWNNGAFTKALVEGLSGLADRQNTGRITIAMLDLYIAERVKELTNGRQSPVTRKPDTVPDFPLALKK